MRLFVGLSFFLGLVLCIAALQTSNIDVAAYYFGNWHVDPRNIPLHGENWTEWELIKYATPRWPGHQQPKVPVWGYQDESLPEVMEQKIEAAVFAGVTVFLFDWYWYDGSLFLGDSIEKGFFGASNNNQIKFALMWANHNWVDLFPTSFSTACNSPQIFSGLKNLTEFQTMTDYIINTYFKHPSYYKIDGKPYFSIWMLTQLVDGLGGMSQAASALSDLRQRVKAAGFPDLHLDAMTTSIPSPWNTSLSQLGCDSVNDYSTRNAPTWPATAYNYSLSMYVSSWQQEQQWAGDVPTIPNVFVGWDASPRSTQSDMWVPNNWCYPYWSYVQGDPAGFYQALKIAVQYLEDNPSLPRLFTINAWNEWTEGSYLEPDQYTGYAYLDALHSLFGQGPQPKFWVPSGKFHSKH